MSPRARRTARVTLAALLGVAAAGVLFAGVTAAQSGQSISIPLPSLGQTMLTAVIAIFAFVGKRAIAKIDEMGQKADKTYELFVRFETRVDAALFGFGGRGGAIDDIRELQATVYHDDGPAPRGVVAPPGFTVSPPVAAKMPGGAQ